jgi:hypothetical protein
MPKWKKLMSSWLDALRRKLRRSPPWRVSNRGARAQWGANPWALGPRLMESPSLSSHAFFEMKVCKLETCRRILRVWSRLSVLLALGRPGCGTHGMRRFADLAKIGGINLWH